MVNTSDFHPSLVFVLGKPRSLSLQTVTNALAHQYDTDLITALKSFTIKPPEDLSIPDKQNLS